MSKRNATRPDMVGNKYALGNKGGRPTKVSPALIALVDEYLSTCTDGYLKIQKDFSDGKDIFEYQFRVALPTIAGLAIYLNISRDTIYEYQKANKEFSDRLDMLMAQQEKRLIEMGLAGIYNSNITKLLLYKHGYSDKVETDLTSKGEKITSITEQEKLALLSLLK